jgi:hypothetical protein
LLRKNETQSQPQTQAPRSEKAARDSPIKESPNELPIEGKVSDAGEERGDGAEPSEGPVVGGEETTRERTLPVLYILVVRWPWRGAVRKQEKVSLFLAVGSSCRQSPVL